MDIPGLKDNTYFHDNRKKLGQYIENIEISKHIQEIQNAFVVFQHQLNYFILDNKQDKQFSEQLKKQFYYEIALGIERFSLEKITTETLTELTNCINNHLQNLEKLIFASIADRELTETEIKVYHENYYPESQNNDTGQQASNLTQNNNEKDS